MTDLEEGVEKGAMDKTEKEEIGKKDSDENNEESKGDTSKDKEKDKPKEGGSDQDVVFVQDVGFTVKIVCPNLEPFDIQVRKLEALCFYNYCIVRKSRSRRWNLCKKSISS